MHLSCNALNPPKNTPGFDFPAMRSSCVPGAVPVTTAGHRGFTAEGLCWKDIQHWQLMRTYAEIICWNICWKLKYICCIILTDLEICLVRFWLPHETIAMTGKIVIVIIIIIIIITIHVSRLLQPSFRRNPVQLWHVILNIRCIWIYGQPGLRNDG